MPAKDLFTSQFNAARAATLTINPGDLDVQLLVWTVPLYRKLPVAAVSFGQFVDVQAAWADLYWVIRVDDYPEVDYQRFTEQLGDVSITHKIFIPLNAGQKIDVLVSFPAAAGVARQAGARLRIEPQNV